MKPARMEDMERMTEEGNLDEEQTILIQWVKAAAGCSVTLCPMRYVNHHEIK